MKNKLLIFLILQLLSFQLIAQDEYTLAKKDQPAPDFSFETPDGKKVQLKDLKGKVVWLTFFATWCGPCRKELPYLEKEVYEKYRNHTDFRLLVIGREHSREELDKFIKDTRHNLPFIPDPKREIFSKYATQNIPRNFIIDKNGKTVVSSVGFNEEDFNKKIEILESLLNSSK